MNCAGPCRISRRFPRATDSATDRPVDAGGNSSPSQADLGRTAIAWGYSIDGQIDAMAMRLDKRAGIDMFAFKHAVADGLAVAESSTPGIAPRHELTVRPCDAIAIIERQWLRHGIVLRTRTANRVAT